MKADGHLGRCHLKGAILTVAEFPSCPRLVETACAPDPGDALDPLERHAPSNQRPNGTTKSATAGVRYLNSTTLARYRLTFSSLFCRATPSPPRQALRNRPRAGSFSAR